MEIDFSDQIRARKLDELKYTDTPEVFLKTSRSDFKYMDIDLAPLLNMPPPTNSSKTTKMELMEVKRFMEQEHSEDFKSSLKKMDEDPAQFIIDSYGQLSGKSISKKLLDL